MSNLGSKQDNLNIKKFIYDEVNQSLRSLIKKYQKWYKKNDYIIINWSWQKKVIEKSSK